MKTNSHTIVIIGAGNVATQLSLALTKAKHTIVQVYSKRKASASKLAKRLNTKHTQAVSKINTTADVYIIAVSDDAISDVANKLKLDKQLVVHTSGSVDMAVLKNASESSGVFYPLQTFSIDRKADFTNIPICLEANNSKSFKVLKSLAKSISKDVQLIDSKQRKTIHLAAVFACNFSNHFYAIADELLQQNNMSLNLIQPLIAETAEKIKKNSPQEMQTGPAIRGDKKIIQQHLDLLEDKELKDIYKLLSKRIQKSK